MPSTYTLIASNVLSSNSSGVTFSSIPSTYTDLVVVCSVRSTRTGATFSSLRAYFNGNSTSTFASATRITGDGASASSARDTSIAEGVFGGFDNASNSTSSTFSSHKFYIPNYAGSTNKPISSISAQESNAITAYIQAHANLWSNTSSISSITLQDYAGGVNNIESGSSFYLYGIKNS
jgi:hypothetical protein